MAQSRILRRKEELECECQEMEIPRSARDDRSNRDNKGGERRRNAPAFLLLSPSVPTKERCHSERIRQLAEK